jgi:hypothetical protein
MKRVAIGRTLLAGILLLSVSVVQAQVTNISHPANSPYLTIQDAISDTVTVNGDTITVAAGTYAEYPAVNKALTFIGSGTPIVTGLTFAATPIRVQGFDLAEITVTPPGKIQEGVDAVNTSGSMNVEPGTYAEHVVINKTMNLIGSGSSNPTINGSGTGSCVTVNAAFVRIKNFILTNAQYGLSGTATSCQFRYFTVHNNTSSGVSLTNSDYNLLHAIHAYNQTGVSSSGIEMISCRNNTITGNDVHDNSYNIRITGTVYRASAGNIVQGNMFLNPGTFSLQVASGAGTTHADFNVFNTTLGGDKFISNTSVPAETLRARHNWFQGHDGPGAPTYPTDFQGIVDSSSWFDNSANTRVGIEPLNYQMVNGDAGYFSVMAMIPDSRQVRATRVTLTWNDTVAIMEDNEIPGSFFFNKMTVAQNETTVITPANPTNSITVYDSLRGGTTGVGGSAGVPYVGTLFIMKFKGVAVGVDSLKLSGLDFRDENLQPVPQVEDWSPGIIVVGSTGPSGLIVDTKVFLQGAYNGSGLDTTLRHDSYLPLTQPFNTAPWSYTGTETVAAVPEAAVDWVLVELRTGTAANTMFTRHAGWLMTDGSIRAFPGSSPIGFSGFDPGNYYVVVRHRNHLAIMSAAAIPISSASANYDFTTGQAQAFGATPMIQVGSAFCMIAGDANGSGDITILDRAAWRTENSLLGFRSADFNLSGDVTILDRAIWRTNNSLITQVP